MYIKIIVSIVLTIPIVTLTSCSILEPDPTATPTSTPTATSTATIPPTSTFTATATPTLTDTPTPTATSTQPESIIEALSSLSATLTPPDDQDALPLSTPTPANELMPTVIVYPTAIEIPTSPPPTVLPPLDASGNPAKLFITYGLVTDGRMLITVEFPYLLQSTHHLSLDGTDYPCQILNGFPARIYCLGPTIKPWSTVRMVIISDNDGQVIYDNPVVIPYMERPTPEHTG